MKHYKDARIKGLVTIVRTIDDSFRLEYTFKGADGWIKTEHDHPYEREHWFGEGSQCLDDITEEEALNIIESWKNN